MNQPTHWKFKWMENDWLRIPIFAVFIIPVIIIAFFYEWLWVSGLKNHPDKVLRNSRTYVNELFISNSSNKAKDERWIEVRYFLRRYGGYNAILVLPTEETTP